MRARSLRSRNARAAGAPAVATGSASSAFTDERCSRGAAERSASLPSPWPTSQHRRRAGECRGRAPAYLLDARSCLAARTRSTRKMLFSCGASTVQSTSTTPGVVSNTRFTSRAPETRRVVAGVHLSDECRQTGGPGGISATFADALYAPRNRVDRRSHGHGDCVTLSRPVTLRDEIHLDVGDVRARAHEVVANESVEVEWRRRARVYLVLFTSGTRRR